MRLGREQGTITKDWGGKFPFVLVYPNLYSVGMANLGFLAVYGLLNRHEDVVCERAFLPDPEEREEMARTGARPFSLETQKPLEAFSFIAFSLSYENDYPHVASILAMAGIPAERRKRTSRHPFILAGGPASFLNPEPMAEIMDFFILGEAEEVLDEVLEKVRQGKGAEKRKDFLRTLLDVEGVYVPSFYHVRYKEDGILASFKPLEGAPEKVRRRWVKDLESRQTAATIFTPDTEFSDIFLLEAGRGCGRHCRFCSTGFIYRPVRYRSLKSLKPLLSEGIRRNLRLGLVSASLGDHPELDDLCQWLPASGGRLSAPSMRLDVLSDSLLESLHASEQKTLTIAPEAGSERLRRVLNKFFADEEILHVTDRLAASGIFSLRLYFMVGLPGEQDEDVEAIVHLTKRIRHRFLKAAKKKARMGEITLSINPFVPKPWSAFQWCAMTEEDVLKARLKRIRRQLQKEPNITVTHGLAKWAFLQALFSRGDRRVHRFVMAGASPEVNWKRQLRMSSLNPDFFVYRERGREDLFPWDFVDHGVSKETLYREYERRFSCTQSGTPPNSMHL